MKRKNLKYIVTPTIALTLTSTVFASTVEETNLLTQNMPEYTFIETYVAEENSEFEILDADDAGSIIKSSINSSEPKTLTLTIDEAVSFLEYADDSDIEEDIEELTDSLNDLRRNQYLVLNSIDPAYVPESEWGSNSNSKTLVDMSPYVEYYQGVWGLEYAISALENTEFLTSVGYEYTLETLAINDNLLKLNLDLSEKALEQQKLNYSRELIKFDLGMISENELNTAENNLLVKELELENLMKSRENLKVTIADTLGLKETDVVNLVYVPKLEMVDKTVEEYVDFHLNSSPSLEIAKANSERAKKVYDLQETYYVEIEDDAKDDRETAIDNSNDLISSIRTATYQSFNNLETYANNLEIAKTNLQSTKKQYEDTLLMYDLGYISKSTLEQVELALISSEVSLENAKYNYDTEKLRLDPIYLTN